MKLSVIVPTYGRPEDLDRCLQGLQQQERLPDEVLLIPQQDDAPTWSLLEKWRGWPLLKILDCPQKGTVAQLNLGLDQSTGDVVAFTDDDAVPRRSWLASIEKHFLSSPDLGGVGGRDVVHEQGKILTGDARRIGRVFWYGRIAGNHHIGAKFSPSVDLLKGVNMSFRAAAIGDLRFDVDLRGKGAQIYNEMGFSLAIQRRGWRLLYDPEILVDHYPAKRFDADQRATPTLEALEDRAFNLYLCLRRHMRRGMRRHLALLWAFTVGTKDSPGALRGWIARLRRDKGGVVKRAQARKAWRAARVFVLERAMGEQ